MTPSKHDPFWLVIARRKLGVGPEWEWCSIEAVDKSGTRNPRRDVIIKGGIPTEKYKSGPRKGQANWKKTERQMVVVTQEEEAAEAAAYEASTGECNRGKDRFQLRCRRHDLPRLPKVQCHRSGVRQDRSRGNDMSIANIIDRRKRLYRFKKINAIVEAACHDNSCKDADKSAVRSGPDYEEREHITLAQAVRWANSFRSPVTLYLYDKDGGIYVKGRQKMRRPTHTSDER